MCHSKEKNVGYAQTFGSAGQAQCTKARKIYTATRTESHSCSVPFEPYLEDSTSIHHTYNSEQQLTTLSIGLLHRQMRLT